MHCASDKVCWGAQAALPSAPGGVTADQPAVPDAADVPAALRDAAHDAAPAVNADLDADEWPDPQVLKFYASRRPS